MAFEWEVVVYDKPGTDRTPVRADHVKNIPAAVNAGILTSAGAIYTDETKSKFAGSALHVIADTKQEVIDFLKTDVYAKAGIWDLDNVIAFPLGLAVRLPKKMDGVTVGFDH